MHAAFTDNALDKRISAASTMAIHIALLAALFAFRHDFPIPTEPALPLSIDLVPAPRLEPPVVEPVPVNVEIGDAGAGESREQAKLEAGSPAPRELPEDMDRTLAPAAAPSFPTGPAPATGIAPHGEIGPGLAGHGSGAGSGAGSGSGSVKARKPAFATPHWIVKPTYSQMEFYNPERAALERVSGTAVLACRIDPRQRARDCRILSEGPRGYGFGKAALATVRLGRISPVKHDGLPVYDAWVRIPVTFRNCSPSDPTCVELRD